MIPSPSLSIEQFKHGNTLNGMWVFFNLKNLIIYFTVLQNNDGMYRGIGITLIKSHCLYVLIDMI